MRDFEISIWILRCDNPWGPIRNLSNFKDQDLVSRRRSRCSEKFLRDFTAACRKMSPLIEFRRGPGIEILLTGHEPASVSKGYMGMAKNG